MATTLVLGTIHAFSVFLGPLEGQLHASRSEISLVYSLALVCLTVCVLFGHRFYGLLRPPLFIVLVCLIAATGCVVAAQATSLAVVFLGYSVLFGCANGLGYGFALQCAAQANPEHKGLAMGSITATYALGAALAPVPFEMLLQAGGFPMAMVGFAIAVAAGAPVIAALLARGKAALRIDSPSGISHAAPRPRLVVILWAGYGTAVAAGLMVIGHATGIAKSGGLDVRFVLYAPVVIAVFNMFGSLVGGWLVDRAGVRLTLTVFPGVSAGALFMLALVSDNSVIIIGLAIVGFTYGATIAAYPAVVATLFGMVAGARVYGRVFTAWGTAGLLAPWLAGFLYGQSADYTMALMVAGGLGLVSFGLAWLLPNARANEPAIVTGE